MKIRTTLPFTAGHGFETVQRSSTPMFLFSPSPLRLTAWTSSKASSEKGNSLQTAFMYISVTPTLKENIRTTYLSLLDVDVRLNRVFQFPCPYSPLSPLRLIEWTSCRKGLFSSYSAQSLPIATPVPTLRTPLQEPPRPVSPFHHRHFPLNLSLKCTNLWRSEI